MHSDRLRSSNSSIAPERWNAIFKDIDMAKAKLGSGKRFSELKGKLASRPGVKNPGALAAYIGREKYGAKKMAKMSAKGRRKS